MKKAACVHYINEGRRDAYRVGTPREKKRNKEKKGCLGLKHHEKKRKKEKKGCLGLKHHKKERKKRKETSTQARSSCVH
eukprot:1160134-Pelagomonas_calceolata.AAC.6